MSEPAKRIQISFSPTTGSGQRAQGSGLDWGLPVRIRNGSCYNDANDTSSQNANIFGSAECRVRRQQLLPLMNPLGPVRSQSALVLLLPPFPFHPAGLIFQYFAHKRRKLFFIFSSKPTFPLRAERS